MIEKTHHLPRGVIDIHGAFQNQQLRFQNGRRERFQLLIVGAVGQVCLEAGIASKAWRIKIPGQKKFPNLAAHLPGQLPGHHAGAARMVLPVDDHDFHYAHLRFLLLSVVIPRGRIHRDKGDELAANLHIDLIDAVPQILVVFREHAVFCEQVLR